MLFSDSKGPKEEGKKKDYSTHQFFMKLINSDNV